MYMKINKPFATLKKLTNTAREEIVNMLKEVQQKKKKNINLIVLKKEK